jgi:aminotransferase
MSRYVSERARRVEIQPQTSISVPGLINLSSGTPDFSPPAFVLDAMRASLDAGKVQYTAWSGLPELRQAIAEKLARESGLAVDPDTEVLVTAGAQEALMTVLMTLLDPGDEMLIADPHYGVYSRVATIAGGRLIPVPTGIESNFTPTRDHFEEALTARTKALILVSPNNPTGTVLPREVLEPIVALANERDLLLISDEIYEHYVYGDQRHTNVASLPGARGRTVTINSLSKGYALTGVRVGYVVAPPGLVRAMLPFHHAMTICAPVTAQYGAIAALTHDRSWFAPILAEYDRRRRLWMKTLDELGLPYGEPQGAYYVFPDIRQTGLDSKTFVARARDEAKLTLDTGGGGAGEGYLRGSLMQASPKLEEGLARFTEFVERLREEQRPPLTQR